MVKELAQIDPISPHPARCRESTTDRTTEARHQIIMPPNSQDVDLICLLGDDSDVENAASAEGGGGAAAAAAKRPATSTSDADADGLGGTGGQKKRRKEDDDAKEGEEDPVDVKPVIAGSAAPAAAAAANKGSASTIPISRKWRPIRRDGGRPREVVVPATTAEE